MTLKRFLSGRRINLLRGGVLVLGVVIAVELGLLLYYFHQESSKEPEEPQTITRTEVYYYPVYASRAPLTSRGTFDRPLTLGEERTFVVTAYSQRPEEGTEDGITFTELPVDYGIVAVDPRVIPLGSVLWIEGYGYALAADIGGAIRGNRLDVFFPDTQKALEFGRRECRVRLVQEGIVDESSKGSTNSIR